MARFFAGAFSPKEISGDVLINDSTVSALDDESLSKAVAYIPSNAELVFSGIRTTVKEEALLTLQFLNIPLSRSTLLLAECAQTLGIEELLERDPFTLSGGESVLAALLVCVVKQPDILILDQVYDSLYPAAQLRLRESIERLESLGTLVVEVHNRAPSWVESFDSCIFIDMTSQDVLIGGYPQVSEAVADGMPWLLPPSAALLRAFESEHRWEIGRYPARPEDAAVLLQPFAAMISSNQQPEMSVPASADLPALVAKNLEYHYPSSNFQLGPIDDFQILQGEIVSLIGPNGAGKTTMLRSLSLLLDARFDQLLAAERPTLELRSPPSRRRRHEWASSVMYCFQRPGDQLWCETARSEFRIAERLSANNGMPGLVDEYVQILGLTCFLDTRPFDLPTSVQKLLSIATCLVAAPPVLLLDEPTAGLDRQQAGRLVEAIRMHRDAGGACLVVSHDIDFVCEHSTRIIEVRDGNLRPLPLQADSLGAAGFLPTIAQVGRYLDPLSSIVRMSQLN